MADWHETTLGALCEAVVDCEHKTAPIDSTGDYFAVGTPAMRGNAISYEEARRISKGTFKAWTKRLRPRWGDLLLAREAPVGPVVRIPREENVAPGQRTVLVRPDLEKVEATFLYYLLTSAVVQDRLLSLAGGSTVSHLNMADIRILSLTIPPTLRDQRAIAEVLGALDDKIAANTRIATTSDHLVRARWIALRKVSEAEIPLGQVAENIRVQVHPADTDPHLPYVGLEHMPRRRMWSLPTATAAEVTSNKSLFKAGDILFGKLRPYFHKVTLATGDGISSTDILVLRALDICLSGYVLAASSADETVAAVVGSSGGTRMPRTSWKDLAAVPVAWPGQTAAATFSAEVQAINDAVLAALKENERLAATRDALLPALMSGKLRVRDAERTVEQLV